MPGRVLVTGGLGFLGGRLGRRLAAAGVAVRAGSRRPDARPPYEAELAVMDLSEVRSLDAAVEGMDAVIHLAAMNDADCARDPAAALEVNGAGTARLVEASVRRGVRRFLYFSTAHVYGAPLEGDIDETRAPRPTHPYATSHLAAEEAVREAQRRGRIEGVVVRLSNAYGAPASAEAPCWKLLVNDLARQAVAQGRLVLRSDGLQRRDFIPLADVERAAMHLLALPATTLEDGLFNLGGNAPWTVIDMARRIAHRAGSVLGRALAVQRPEPAAGAVPRPLAYHARKLAATGFRPEADPDAEIDALLKACQGWFAA